MIEVRDPRTNDTALMVWILVAAVALGLLVALLFDQPIDIAP